MSTGSHEEAMPSTLICSACGTSFAANASGPHATCPDCRAAAVSERPIATRDPNGTAIQKGMPRQAAHDYAPGAAPQFPRGSGNAAAGAAKKGGRFAAAKPYLAPFLITLILAAGSLEFRLLESHWGTAVAILTCVIAETALSLFMTGKWPHLASCYITGISVGIILRTPVLWPYIVCSLLSITSKYALRINNRHLWNPSNLGVSVLLFLVPEYAAPLSQQWGNTIWVPLIILFFGFLILGSLGRLHITVAFIAAFTLLSFVQVGYTHGDWKVVWSILQGGSSVRDEWINHMSLLTAPPYLLFMIFMITDPKTTTCTKTRQIVVVVLVAVAEMILRLNREIHAPYYALFIVAPLTNFAEILWEARQKKTSAARAANPAASAATPLGPAPLAAAGKTADPRRG